MWRCPNCKEEVSDDFDACWSCGTRTDGTPDPAFRRVPDAPGASVAAEQGHPVACPRCNLALTFIGTKKLHEGTRVWDAMGGVWELFKHRESFDVYMCPRCGRVEFFVDGVGEEFRPH
jgi:hypothetical protein